MGRSTILTAGILALAAVVSAREPARAQTPGRGPKVRPVAAPPADRQVVLDGNAAFALDVYGQLRAAPGNFMFSPLSLSAALAMATAGADGVTRDQMASTLHLDLPQYRLDAAFQSVLADLRPSVRSHAQLGVAHALWASLQFPLRPDYVSELRTRYGARAAALDFAGNPEKARRAINLWGARQTNGRILEAHPPGSVLPETAFMLTNAVYFKAKWKTPFPVRDTQTQPFSLADGGQVAAPLMRAKGEVPFAWFSDEGFEAVDLPYRGCELSITILVPDALDGLSALESALTPANLARWIGGLQPADLVVLLPRFRLRSSVDFVDALKALGTTDAFGAGVADFSRAVGSLGASISGVSQSAFVETNEAGSEAAAVTNVGVGITVAPTVFSASRRFLFLIRHQPTGMILFMGRVEDPTK